MTTAEIITAQITTGRRMGRPGSDNWNAMLDAAADILRDEGHAELTSRRVAERLGVKQRLVYYYFRTMDDLIVETFRRLSKAELARLREAARTDHALREIWNTNLGSTDARLISEFMALANRIEDLRSEVIAFIEDSRALQVEVLDRALQRRGVSSRIASPGLAIIATSLALSLNREAQLGVRFGHDDIAAAIETFLTELEP